MQCSSKRAAKIDNYIGNNKEKRKEKKHNIPVCKIYSQICLAEISGKNGN